MQSDPCPGDWPTRKTPWPLRRPFVGNLMTEAQKAMARAYAALKAADKVIGDAKPFVRGDLVTQCTIVKTEVTQAGEELERVRKAELAKANKDYVPLAALSLAAGIVLLLRYSDVWF